MVESSTYFSHVVLGELSVEGSREGDVVEQLTTWETLNGIACTLALVLVWIVDIGWAEARSLHSADVLVRELAVDLVLLNELIYFGGFVGLLELESNDV